MNLIEVYRAFHRVSIQQKYPSGARMLFDAVMYKLNEERWIDEVVLSERDLTELTQLPKTTLHEAKHYLTSRKMLSCQTTKRGTCWRFGDAFLELLGVKVQPKIKNSRSNDLSISRSNDLPISRSNDLSIFRSSDLSISPLLSGVEMSPTTELPISRSLDLSISPPVEEIQLSPVTEFATDHAPTTLRPRSDHKPTTVENSNITRVRDIDRDGDTDIIGEDVREKIFFSWRDEMKIPLTPFLKSELGDMHDKYGAAKVIMAIRATSATRTFKTLADVWRYVRMSKYELLALTRGETDENARRDNRRNDGKSPRTDKRHVGRRRGDTAVDAAKHNSANVAIREVEDADPWGLPQVEHHYERYDESWILESENSAGNSDESRIA